MVSDFSWLNEGMPIFAFVLLFVIVYATLVRTKILGEGKTINAITSFILAVIFISFTSIRNFVTNVTPWFAVLFTLSFFFLMLIFFIFREEKMAIFTKPFAIIFIILFALIIIGTLFYSFPSTQAYLPGASEAGANDFLLNIKHFLLEERFLNGLLLLVIAIIVGFIITRG
jgi:hypothetical protein